MPAVNVEQQSIVGSFFSFITFPFRMLLRAVMWILSLILKIILFPFRVLFAVAAWIWQHMPKFYAENVFHSFKGFLCFFGVVLIGLTAMLVVLIPLHIIPLAVVHRLLNNFNLIHAVTVMAKTFCITEGIFIATAIGGFLLSFLAAFVLITLYSSLQALVEFTGELTERRVNLVVMFFVVVMMFAVLYLILKGIIPI
ncbi:hypothetical protein CSA56_13345 [candidate division KSB3 bacterium]|uniref:Uncharacterized protein n=1 Tax=candidate division KSB3 bacterium TaxID=2044937 RepID=A0A2G6KBI1_9BACT|nr:MAG: hypothetical protein CSA56_13345 [candidate division KSB3 bacterium]